MRVNGCFHPEDLKISTNEKLSDTSIEVLYKPAQCKINRNVRVTELTLLVEFYYP